MFACPTCHGNARVTRTDPHPLFVKRYRKCIDCGRSISTFEVTNALAMKALIKEDEVVEQP